MEDQDQFLICGTKAAYEQALKTMFYDPEKVFNVSGMILKKCFYDQTGLAHLTHRDIGLSSDVPTALIMFGGNGSDVSEKIVTQLEKAKLDVQTIVMCGHNSDLYKSLQGKRNCHAVGFVPNVPDYMRLADIFIGKPGPGCISEAIHLGCPVIIENNAATLPQERPNVDWILDNGIGMVVKSFNRGMARAVRNMIGDLEKFRKNIKDNVPQNRAIYEITDILATIVESDSLRFPEVAENRVIN
jgi:1,2-diacylglycerol 3-beta-galactosyltransferase